MSEIVQRLQVARGAHHVLGFAQLQHRTARLLVGLLDGLDHLGVRDAVGGQFVGVQHHLVLAHHAAYRGHFRHIGHGLEFVLQEPVLQGTQLTRILCASTVHQGVLVNPAHTRGVGPQRRLGAGRQTRLNLVQVLQHT